MHPRQIPHRIGRGFHILFVSARRTSLAGTHCWCGRGCPQCGGPQASGRVRGDAMNEWLCTNQQRCRICLGRFWAGGGVRPIRAIRGFGPIVGGAVVVRNAELAGPKNACIRGRGIRTSDGCRCGCPQCGCQQRPPPAAVFSQKLTSGRFSPAVSPGRKTLLSGFTSPQHPASRFVGAHP